MSIEKINDEDERIDAIFNRREKIESLRETYLNLRKREKDIEDRMDAIIQDPYSQKSVKTPRLLKDLLIDLENAREETRKAFDQMLESIS